MKIEWGHFKLDLSWQEILGALALLLAPSPLKGIMKNRGEINMDSPIKNILEVEAFASAVVKAGIEAKKNDGTVDFKDTPLFLPALMLLPPAIDQFTMIDDEFKVLPEHIDELAAKIAPDFGLDPNGDIIFYTTQAVEMLKIGVKVYQRLKAPKVA